MSDPIREGILPKYFVCVSFSRLLCTIIWRYVGSTKTIWEMSSMQEWGEKRVGQRKEHMEEGVAFLHRRLLRWLSVRFSLLSARSTSGSRWEGWDVLVVIWTSHCYDMLWYNCTINTQLTCFSFLCLVYCFLSTPASILFVLLSLIVYTYALT